MVTRTGSGLSRECPDHYFRKADCKHIKAALEVTKKNKGYKNTKFKIMEGAKLQHNIVYYGYRYGVQIRW